MQQEEVFKLVQLFGIVCSALVFITVLNLIRKGLIRERHALWWIIGAILALVLSIDPQPLRWVADFVGIELASNLIFLVCILILFLASLQTGTELTEFEGKIRTLAERLALLEFQVRAKEDQPNKNGRHD